VTTIQTTFRAALSEHRRSLSLSRCSRRWWRRPCLLSVLHRLSYL